MTGFHLRAVKCPGCGAQVPYTNGVSEVRCEYCQQVSVVQGLRSPPAPSPYPQVTPSVRPIAIVLFSVLAVSVASSAGLWLFLRAPQAPAEPATLPSEAPAAYVYAEPSAYDEDRVSAEPEPVSVAQVAALDSQLDAGTRNEAKEQARAARARPTPKARPKKPPDGYAIAKIIKPVLSGCAPRDLMAPGHPVWYTPTITTTVIDGTFQKTVVSVALSNTDLSTIHFSRDRDQQVTQADLDERQSQVAACIRRRVDATSIPADSPQLGVEGRLSITFTWDGVPYGIKSVAQ